MSMLLSSIMEVDNSGTPELTSPCSLMRKSDFLLIWNICTDILPLRAMCVHVCVCGVWRKIVEKKICNKMTTDLDNWYVGSSCPYTGQGNRSLSRGTPRARVPSWNLILRKLEIRLTTQLQIETDNCITMSAQNRTSQYWLTSYKL